MKKLQWLCWLLVGGLGWMPVSQAQIMGGVEVDPAKEPQPVSAGLNPWVAQVKVLRSQAWVERDGRRLLVEVGMRLRQQDVLETGLAGAVGITFDDNSTLSVGPNTHIVIQRFAFDTTTHQGAFDARVQRGTVAVQPGYIARREPEAMRISTPAATLRSRAGGYLVSVEGD
jgi:hypothetical protein